MDELNQTNRSENPSQELASPVIRYVQFPTNLGVLPNPSGQASILGVCGDSMEVTIKVEDGVVKDIRALPNGCGYTAACASAMTELAKGRMLDEAVQLEPEDIKAVLGGLPQDHYHCAQLALESLCAAIEDYYRKTRPADDKA